MNEATRLFRRSYGRGLVIFLYGLAWLGACAGGLLAADRLFPAGDSLIAVLLMASAASALAGAMGGAAAMLQRLGQNLAVAADFQRHSLLSYLLLPLAGLLAGIASLYLVIVPTSLLINFVATRTFSLNDLAASSTVVALQILLAGIAGYYQLGGLVKLRAATPDYSPLEASALEELEPGQQGRLESILPPQFETPADAAEAPFAFKVWFEQRQEIIRWSASWGLFIFFYGLAWLVGLGAVLLKSGSFFEARLAGSVPVAGLMAAAWVAITSGGMGGVIGMYSYLYQHISIKQDFQRQHLMSYLVQPVLGLFFGGAVSFFLASGYLSFQSIAGEAPPVVDSPLLIAAQIVLGWLAGFRPNWLPRLVRRVIQAVVSFLRAAPGRVSPRDIWDQAARADTLSDLAHQAELFRNLDHDSLKRKP